MGLLNAAKCARFYLCEAATLDDGRDKATGYICDSEWPNSVYPHFLTRLDLVPLNMFCLASLQSEPITQGVRL